MSKLLEWSTFAPNDEAFHIASYQIAQNEQPDLHTHDYAEIFWITEGEGLQIGIQGGESIQRGSLFIVHPEVVHRFASEHSMTLINVGFPSKILGSLRKLFDSVPVTHTSSLPYQYTVNDNGLIELNRAVNELVSSPNEEVYLWRFLTRCMCVLSAKRESVPADAPDWLRHACQEIRQPDNAKEGVERFVKLAGRSPEHVSRFTRKWTGKAPREIAQEARLNLVARELVLTEKPILEITLDAGFENLGHCYKLFKEKYGAPPAEYRKSQKRLPAGIML